MKWSLHRGLLGRGFAACVCVSAKALPKVKQKLQTFSADLPAEYQDALKQYAISGVSASEAILLALHTHDRLGTKEKRQQMQVAWDQLRKDSETLRVDIKAKMLPVLKEQTLKFLVND